MVDRWASGEVRSMSKKRSDSPAQTGQPPLHADDGRMPAATSRSEIDAFLDRVKSLGPVGTTGERGRLIFALDATMSRQPTWDTACRLQADMFRRFCQPYTEKRRASVAGSHRLP